MTPCFHFLLLLVVLMVMDSAVHKLNHLRHEMLNLWRTSVACSIVLVKTLLCLIFYLLLSWVFMPYVIYSVPLLVLCNRRLLHVVPMIFGSLSYYEWLLLSLVGITVCGCNQIIQICGFRLIGGKEYLIFWSNLYWFLPAVIIFPTIEGGSLYLCLIVPLWSGFLMS